MIALLCFFLALFVSPFKSKSRLEAENAAVPVGNLRPEILVMQPAQNWHRQRATDGLDSTWDWRVLVQR
jgi:hypothetical protein